MKINNIQIIWNREIAQDIWEMKLDAPQITALYKGPGQFINILAAENWDIILRRPMSISAVENDSLSFIYKKLGQVTKILSSKVKFEYLNVLGPLGNTFTNWDNPQIFPILVGGGTGLAPLLNMHYKCLSSGLKHVLVLGARNKAQHFLQHIPEKGIYLCTDDGSLGIKGTVMSALEQILKKHRNPHLFSCGPEPMLKAVQALALKNQIVCQLSVESYMACGTGLCQGCVVSKNNRDVSSSANNYSLVCIQGPVYGAQEVLFD